MRCHVIFLVLIASGSLTLSYGQSLDTNTQEKRLVPYTENSNVQFTSEGKINYDLLIAKIMPEIFEKKLQDLGANLTSSDIVLERGFHILIYEQHSYNCGFAIDKETNKVYWLEAAINRTQIQYANVYLQIPRDDDSKMGFDSDCFSFLETRVSENLLQEKSYFTPYEETLAVSSVKHYLRGNENLNHYQIKVGKFNHDYGGNSLLSICGEFVGRNSGSHYFRAILHDSGLLSFTLEKKLSTLCAIDENSTLYDIKYQDRPNKGDSLQSWQNTRHDMVFLKPSSAEKLLERNYLQLESIPSLNLEYASHLKPEDIEYQPENSNTVLKFTPFETTSYMKIRMPDNGVNYYFSYGDEDWYDGKLLRVSVFVDGNEVKYATSNYVRSPEAPYPSHYTDLVFKVPANSTNIKIHLEIENYTYTKESSDAWR